MEKIPPTYGKVYGTFSHLLIDAQRPSHPWEGGPELCKEVGWAVYGEQASRQWFFTVSPSVLPPGSFPDFLSQGTVRDKVK